MLDWMKARKKEKERKWGLIFPVSFRCSYTGTGHGRWGTEKWPCFECFFEMRKISTRKHFVFIWSHCLLLKWYIMVQLNLFFIIFFFILQYFILFLFASFFSSNIKYRFHSFSFCFLFCLTYLYSFLFLSFQVFFLCSFVFFLSSWIFPLWLWSCSFFLFFSLSYFYSC